MIIMRGDLIQTNKIIGMTVDFEYIKIVGPMITTKPYSWLFSFCNSISYKNAVYSI